MSSGSRKVFVSIVTFNSSQGALRTCLRALLRQSAESDLFVRLIDNASADDPWPCLKEEFQGRVHYRRNAANLGYCGANNQAAAEFLAGGYQYFFLLNPDVCLRENCLLSLQEALDAHAKAGSACPKLLRADANLLPLTGPVIDSTGIAMAKSLRHFDRGNGQVDAGQFDCLKTVFGGSGAALLMKLECVKDLLLVADVSGSSLYKVYPQLLSAGDRAPLFDEAFFAYREDADLAWRAQTFGWECLFVPEAVGYHDRKVVPENRSRLDPSLNALGVKNRFLLQLNNYRPWELPGTFLPGFLLRNILVFFAVIIAERSSISGLRQFLVLFRRGLIIRRFIKAKAGKAVIALAPWFGAEK